VRVDSQGANQPGDPAVRRIDLDCLNLRVQQLDRFEGTERGHIAVEIHQRRAFADPRDRSSGTEPFGTRLPGVLLQHVLLRVAPMLGYLEWNSCPT
jgi:hypothetical protein